MSMAFPSHCCHLALLLTVGKFSAIEEVLCIPLVLKASFRSELSDLYEFLSETKQCLRVHFPEECLQSKNKIEIQASERKS